MHLRRGPFWWPWRCASAIQSTSPDAAWPGLPGSNWTLPLGNYSLRIAPAAARATANKTTMQHVPTLLAILMAVAMWQYYTPHIARWRRFVAFTKATKLHHWTSTRSNSINQTHQRRLFLRFHREKGPELTCWPLITIRVWQIKMTRST
jgi:hypothetical protein